MKKQFDNFWEERGTALDTAANSRERALVEAMPQDGGRPANLLLEYVRIIGRKYRLILLCAFAGALLGFLLNVSAMPVYRARTSLDIQSLNSDLPGMHAVSATGDGGGTSGESYVQTQIKLLQSQTLVEGTVRALQAQPHDDLVPQQDLISRLQRTLHIGRTTPLTYAALLQDTARRVQVKQMGLSRLVEITCDSWDPEFAAQFCNAMTSTFREQDYATRGASAAKISEWLTHQVADVRIQVEQSQDRLEKATGGNGLVQSEQNTSVAGDRLREVQSELVRAEADRMGKQAEWELSQSAPPETLPNVIDDPNFRQSQQRLADLESKVAELVPPLTEENPKVIHYRSQIKEVQLEMAQERNAIVHRMRDEYDAAKHRESLLSHTYQAQEQTTSSELDKAGRVSLLRREVESERQLYQTLLQRAKEAGFASAMQVSTIRIVDAAEKAKMAITPRRGMNMAVGFMLGSLAGLGFAFYKDRTSGIIHQPGEVQRLLHIQELGVIPSFSGARSSIRGSYSYARPLNGSKTEGVPQRVTVLAALTAHVHRKRVVRENMLGLDKKQDAASPSSPTLSIWKGGYSIAAEAYRSTTFSILLASRSSKNAKTYVVSSPNAGEGKTTVVSNLGVALSQSQRRVVLIDGDLRKPGIHKAFNLENKTGMRNLLRGEVDATTGELDAFCQKTAIPNLSVITAGTGHEGISELLHSAYTSKVLARLQTEFDLVLIDTPPMLHMSDARIFANHADGVILVYRAGVTNFAQASAAYELFVHDRKHVLGTILNGFNPSESGMGSYYDSYARYQDAAEDLKEHATA